MSTLTTINGSDNISSSRTVINTNFSNLNSDKIETSVLDTDTTLAANSDSKVATQKAVKAYVDAGGNVNASTTTRGIVEEATIAEIIAGTAVGGTGARLFINPSLTTTSSAGAADEGKIPRLNSSGKLPSTMTSLSWVGGSTTKDISATTTTTIAHGLGATPQRIAIYTAFNGSNSSTVSQARVIGGTSYYECIMVSTSTTFNTANKDNFMIYDTSAAYITGTVSVDATNISITWSKSGSPTGTATIKWEAFG